MCCERCGKREPCRKSIAGSLGVSRLDPWGPQNSLGDGFAQTSADPTAEKGRSFITAQWNFHRLFAVDRQGSGSVRPCVDAQGRPRPLQFLQRFVRFSRAPPGESSAQQLSAWLKPRCLLKERWNDYELFCAAGRCASTSWPICLSTFARCCCCFCWCCSPIGAGNRLELAGHCSV